MATYPNPPRYGLRVITPPEFEPVQLGEAMEHLNIQLGDRHNDGWLRRNIPAARQYCEGWLGRTLAPQVLEVSYGAQSMPSSLPTYWQPLMLNPWTEDAVQRPYGPVSEIVSVVYVDEDGESQTMDPEDYVLDTWSDVAVLSLAHGATWPTVQGSRNAIQIRYLAGYTFPEDSPSPYPLPWDLRTAMLLMLGHLFENREATQTGGGNTTLSHEIPLGPKAWMEPYRLRMGMA